MQELFGLDDIKSAFHFINQVGLHLTCANPVDPDSAPDFTFQGEFWIKFETKQDWEANLIKADEIQFPWIGKSESDLKIFFATESDLKKFVDLMGWEMGGRLNGDTIIHGESVTTQAKMWLGTAHMSSLSWVWLGPDDIITLANRLAKLKGMNREEADGYSGLNQISESVNEWGLNVIRSAGYKIYENTKPSKWFDYYIASGYWAIALHDEKLFQNLLEKAIKHNIIWLQYLSHAEGGYIMYLGEKSSYDLLLALCIDKVEPLTESPKSMKLLKIDKGSRYSNTTSIGYTRESEYNALLGMMESNVIDLISRIDEVRGHTPDETQGMMSIGSLTERCQTFSEWSKMNEARDPYLIQYSLQFLASVGVNVTKTKPNPSDPPGLVYSFMPVDITFASDDESVEYQWIFDVLEPLSISSKDVSNVGSGSLFSFPLKSLAEWAMKELVRLKPEFTIKSSPTGMDLYGPTGKVVLYTYDSIDVVETVTDADGIRKLASVIQKLFGIEDTDRENLEIAGQLL